MTANKIKNKLKFLQNLNEIGSICKGHKNKLTLKPT